MEGIKNPEIKPDSNAGTTLGRAPFKNHRKHRPKPLIFDSLEEAKNDPLFLRIYTILIAVFGGLYIQSNNVENGFNVKAALKPHRVMKVGIRILKLVLYSQMQLKQMSTRELREYLRSRISIYTIMDWIPPTNKGPPKPVQGAEEIRRLVEVALHSGQIFAISYRDGKNVLTRRGIIVKEIEGNYIKAHCLLRDERRTFRADRILYAYLTVDKPMVFS